ncbi:unnamed protein product [Paramecium sonneborni]|uniref:Uncharacterized protein n=1 Tax=Paramecium sonneborni TaxID=65129 RepID=A0A8S1QH65_9CILI|nr:unnamed protein product [Paramecium sonneborni]
MKLLSLIFFIIIFKLGLSQTLYYEAFSSVTLISMEDWATINAYGNFSDCDGTQIFGGFNTFGMGTKVMKLIQLPPHFYVQIKMKFWKIDTWDNEYFNINIDGAQAFSQQYQSISSISECGNSWGEEIQLITISLPHFYQSILIYMFSTLDENPSNESWGFRDFQLFLYLCPPDCLSCTSDDLKKDCVLWSIVDFAFLEIYLSTFQEGWQIINGIQGNSDCNGIQFYCGYGRCGHNSIIQKTLNLPTHQQLMIRFRLGFFDSWDNEYVYLNIDGNLVFSQSHFFYQEGNADLCGLTYSDYLPNFQIIIDHSDAMIRLEFTTSLDESLINESFGLRDFQIFTKIIKTCGNGVIEQTEQCDDGNIYAFDGCFICQYSCVEGCLNCIDGICFECDIGWIFKSDFNTYLITHFEKRNLKFHPSKQIKTHHPKNQFYIQQVKITSKIPQLCILNNEEAIEGISQLKLTFQMHQILQEFSFQHNQNNPVQNQNQF